MRFHGDLADGNLLVDARGGRRRDRLRHLGVGDPSCDLAIAWTLLDDAGRQLFRDRLAVDDASWSRGRGWAAGRRCRTCRAHSTATIPTRPPSSANRGRDPHRLRRELDAPGAARELSPTGCVWQDHLRAEGDGSWGRPAAHRARVRGDPARRSGTGQRAGRQPRRRPAAPHHPRAARRRAPRLARGRRGGGGRRGGPAALARLHRGPAVQPVRRPRRRAPGGAGHGHVCAARRGREPAPAAARPRRRHRRLRRPDPRHRDRPGHSRGAATATPAPPAAGRDRHRPCTRPRAVVEGVVRGPRPGRAVAHRARRLPPSAVQPRDLRAGPRVARLRLEPRTPPAGRRVDPGRRRARLRCRRRPLHHRHGPGPERQVCRGAARRRDPPGHRGRPRRRARQGLRTRPLASV